MAKAPCKRATGCGQGQPEREADDTCGQKRHPRGQQPPAGTVGYGQPAGGARKGLSPVASPIANRGGDASRRGGRPLARAAVACATVATMQRGKERLGHPLEKRMILPL
ncbi:hypothetical protein BHM03_00058097 [Ensete ventricosum]|nr:hypothetical protein BHM03_00058097 [Ensete ventricosum]